MPRQGGSGQPKGLLQQMEELTAALNADLTALDADLRGPGGSEPGGDGPGRAGAGEEPPGQ